MICVKFVRKSSHRELMIIMLLALHIYNNGYMAKWKLIFLNNS